MADQAWLPIAILALAVAAGAVWLLRKRLGSYSAFIRYSLNDQADVDCLYEMLTGYSDD